VFLLAESPETEEVVKKRKIHTINKNNKKAMLARLDIASELLFFFSLFAFQLTSALVLCCYVK